MRERKPKRNIKFRTYKDYETEVKRQLNEVEKAINHLRVKGKYGIGTTTTQAMLSQGLSRRDIQRYWKRELQILTGEYEEMRDWQFIKNYIKVLQANNIGDELINEFRNLARFKKKRKYLISRLPDFAFWGYGKTNEKRQLSDDELTENITELENVIKKVKEKSDKTIK